MSAEYHDDREPQHASSTDRVLAELQLYSYRPFQDEPDPRPPPDARIAAGAIADIFDAFVNALFDTRVEPDLENLLWSTVNLFHRAIGGVERELDDKNAARRHFFGSKSMDDFVHRQNIAHFHLLLKTETSDVKRKMLLKLLVEEREKLAAATVVSGSSPLNGKI